MTNVALVAHGSLRCDGIFDPGRGRDNCLERFHLLQAALRTRGIRCRTADMYQAGDIDVLIFHDLQAELATVLRTVKANPRVRLVYLPNEPALIAPLHREEILAGLPVDAVLTWNNRLAHNYPRMVKCNIGQPVIEAGEIPVHPFCDRELLCCIYSNKWSPNPDALYGERLRAIEFFSGKPCGMALYGMGWENSHNPAVAASYRGPCESKKEVLRRFRFALAFENVRGVPGLITEKLFDCLAAGTVPVYHGAPDVDRYVPPACFVDFRRFRGYRELFDFLAGMTETEHGKYLAAAREFIRDPRYREFTSTRYVEIVTDQVTRLTASPSGDKTVAGVKVQLLKLLAGNPRALAEWRRLRRFLYDLATVW